jgi:hypothetical protein
MTASPRQLLAEALRDEIEQLRRVQREAIGNRLDFAEHAPQSLRDLRGIAGNLADIYQGAENAFQRVGRTTGEPVPSGREWHRELLEQMSREVPSVRPAVILIETRVALDPFRRFRHRARHHYGFELNWEDLQPLLEMAESVVAALVRDLEVFCNWLDQVADVET